MTTSELDCIRGVTNEEIDLDRLREAWRAVQAARTSAQHFRARLRRATPIVAEMAALDPQLARAMGVLAAMMANFSLADDTLGALPLPGDLLAELVAIERGDERAVPVSAATA
jgi:hypothetical protein